MFLANVLFFLFIVNQVHFGRTKISDEKKNEIGNNIKKSVTVLPCNVRWIAKFRKHNNPYIRTIRIKIEKNNSSPSMPSLFVSIYTHEFSPGKKEKSSISLQIFYICVNCKLSIWLKNWLFSKIKDLPLSLSQQPDLANYKRENDSDVSVREILINELNSLVIFINRFINILSTLINVEPLTNLSYETIVLRSLYELKFKIHYFASLETPTIAEEVKIDIIFRENLIVMNHLQSFVVTNCYEEVLISEDNVIDNERPIGYTINLKNLDEMDSFLNYINYFDLESQLYSCSVEQILLFRFLKNTVGTHESRIIADAILNSKVTLMDNEKQSIKELLTELQKPHGIAEVYIYLKSVSNVIIVILNSKVESMLSKYENTLNDSVVLYFDDLKNKIKIHNFPDVLLVYFDRLVNLLKTEVVISRVLQFMNDYYQTIIQRVELSPPESDFSLSLFIEEITKYENDFECVKTFLPSVQNTFERHYVPFGVEALKRKNTQSASNTNECCLIKTMYAICLKIIFSLKNDIRPRTDQSSHGNDIRDSSVIFETLKRYFLWVEYSNVQDKTILKIATNASIILVNINYSEIRMYKDNYRRTTYLIMTELSDYGFKYCGTMSDFQNYTLLNSVDLKNIADNDVLSTRISESLNIPIEKLNTLPDHTHLNLQYFYANFIEKSKVFNKYNDIVKFYWKGRKKSIKRIYLQATSSLPLNPQFLYAFYDIFFKFYIGSFVYEIKKFYNFKRLQKIENVDAFNQRLRSFVECYFPDTMKPFIVYLKKSASYPILSEYIKPEYLHKNFVNSIKNGLTELLIVLESKTKISPYTEYPEVKIFKDMFAINNELGTIVKTVFENYSVLIKNKVNI